MDRSKKSKKTSPSNGPLFPKFTKLPFKIGSMIVKYSSPGPKIITIGCKTVQNNNCTESKQLTVSYPIPPFLHMNTACRAMAKRLYTYAFEKNLGHNRGVYFDWASDALVFESLDAATEFFRLEWAPRQLTEIPILKLLSVGILLENRPLVLGFSEYRNEQGAGPLWQHLQFISKAMEMLGEPKHIVLTRRGGVVPWNAYYYKNVELYWRMALVDDDLLLVVLNKDYQFPGITFLTFIQLQAKLVCSLSLKPFLVV
ncbi:hypothetical protein IFR05_008805 [Cadophora sp. M221]|nr:hypothetical protein IFR05_008805 [Cadophora sp. M221]